MKRYDLDYECGGESERCRTGMIEANDGDYVQHDEAAAEIAALREKLDKAEARVAVLTEECRAWHKAEDWLLWDIGEPNDFAAAKREFDEAQRRLDAARAATGPLPAKEGTDA